MDGFCCLLRLMDPWMFFLYVADDGSMVGPFVAGDESMDVFFCMLRVMGPWTDFIVFCG